jgi:2-iminobutanoate/2-iminopropanoate deaminase
MSTQAPLRAAVTQTPAGRPGVLSPAFIAEGCFVHVSGQGPLVDGAYTPATIEEEARLALANLGAVLEAAGSSPAHVVRCGVFLADLGDFEPMNAAWSEFFADPRPARTTIQAGALPGGIKIEIDAVALVGDAMRDRLRAAATEGEVLDVATLDRAAA